MLLTEQMKASHHLISPLFAQWLERLNAEPETITHIQREGLVKAAFRYPMNAWPFFGDDTFKAMVAEATESVMRLCCLIPERIFGDDMEGLAKMFGFASAEMAEIAVRKPNGMELAMARPDFLLTSDGFKCLETNTSPNLGGIYTQLWVDEYLRLPHVHAFLEENALTPLFMDATDGFFLQIFDLTRELREGKDLVVAMVVDAMIPENEMSPIFNQMAKDQSLKCGLDLEPDFLISLAYPEGLTVKDDFIYCEGKRVHLMLGDIKVSKEIMEVFRKGNVQFLNSPASFLMSDKRCLGLLSQHADLGRFSDEERELIHRFIPWSRLLKQADVTYKGKDYKLLELLEEKQECFVLKPGQGMRGEQVILGCTKDKQQWLDAVEAGVKQGNWVVQELLESIPFMAKGENDDLAAHQVIWGFFSYQTRLVGTFLRSQKLEGGSGIINSASGAIESVLMFI